MADVPSLPALLIVCSSAAIVTYFCSKAVNVLRLLFGVPPRAPRRWVHRIDSVGTTHLVVAVESTPISFLASLWSLWYFRLSVMNFPALCRKSSSLIEISRSFTFFSLDTTIASGTYPLGNVRQYSVRVISRCVTGGTACIVCRGDTFLVPASAAFLRPPQW